MRSRPTIALTERWPMTWLFLHGHRAGDFSGLARRFQLTSHRGLPWPL